MSGPNVLVVLADDMGFSDLGCYGGEIRTPQLDGLAARGLRMSQFYNTARCSPSRASLLTGQHPHRTGIGILCADDRPHGYPGTLDRGCPTLAELLGAQGWATYMSGKWHVCGQLHEPCDAWPTRRGFDRFYGTIAGAGSYFDPVTLTRDETSARHATSADDFYYTDAISDAAERFVHDHAASGTDQPFFLYLAYTAPHWPLHAFEEDVAAYDGHYDEGWDVLRERRYRRLVDDGVLDGRWPLSDRDPKVGAWADTDHRDWQARRMQVYAAQVERMDRGIGRVLAALDATARRDDTIVVFLSDNGGCAEEQALGWTDEIDPRPVHVPTATRDGRRVLRGNTPSSTPGPETTYASYGRCWANLSNTPFREYKHWVHEGGIATPFIVSWPGRLPEGGVCHSPYQLPDIAATLLDACGVERPAEQQGVSMLPAWTGGEEPEHTLYWEHEGNAAVRRGRWKLVHRFGEPWELYDMDTDRTELTDLAQDHPDRVADLSAAWRRWADTNGVVPRERLVSSG